MTYVLKTTDIINKHQIIMKLFEKRRSNIIHQVLKVFTNFSYWNCKKMLPKINSIRKRIYY